MPMSSITVGCEPTCRFATGLSLCSMSRCGFVIHFLKVPLACSGSLAAAVQINGLKNSKENILHSLLDELLPQNVIVILNREEHSGAFFAGSV